MKTFHLLLIYLIFGLVCKNEPTKHSIQANKTIVNAESLDKNEALPEPKDIKEDLNYDTIKINYDSIHFRMEQKNERYQKLNLSDLIDSLQLLSTKKDIRIFEDADKLFGDYDSMGLYYTINIPKFVYEKIFPEEEIATKKTKILDKKVDEKGKKVYLREGTKVEEERVYKHLYMMKEKDQYLQMILTKQRKYSPELMLFNISKADFKIKGKLSLLGGIYDSYDINYWHAELSANYDVVQITHVENQAFDDIKFDTMVTKYKISSMGEIIEWSEE